jgi:hypothetical protein
MKEVDKAFYAGLLEKGSAPAGLGGGRIRSGETSASRLSYYIDTGAPLVIDGEIKLAGSGHRGHDGLSGRRTKLG